MENLSENIMNNLSILPIQSRIILYGLNEYGQEIYKNIIKDNNFRIVKLIDKKITSFNYNNNTIFVEKPEKIKKFDYDYILITVRTEKVAKEIRNELLKLGVNTNKMLWLGSLHKIYTDAEQNFLFSNRFHYELCKSRLDLKDKKVIFVIDWEIPLYDTNTGDRYLYTYLKLFTRLGYHVIYYPNSQVDYEAYTLKLRKMGIEVLVNPLWDIKMLEEWLKLYGKYINFVNLYRPNIAIRYIDLFKKYTNAKIFYFPHDLHYIRLQRQFKIEKNDKILKEALEIKKIEFKLIEVSDAAFVLGSFEEKALKEEFHNKDIVNIPIYVWNNDELASMPQVECNKNNNIIFVGGFNHAPNVDGIKWFVAEILPVILKNNPDVKLFVVGSHPTQEIINMENEHIHVTGYVSDEKLNELYASSKLAVVPLRFGAGIKGKVVETLFNGLPLITTSIGAEGLEGLNKCVQITDDPYKFAEYVNEFMQNDELCLKYAKMGQQYIVDNFSANSVKKIIKKYYN